MSNLRFCLPIRLTTRCTEADDTRDPRNVEPTAVAFEIDRYAHITSPLARWDARIKIAALGTVIVVISLLQTIPLAFVALLVAGSLLLLARLPWELVSGGVRWLIFFLVPFFVIMPLSYPGASDADVLGIPVAMGGVRLATLIVLKALAIAFTAYATFGTSRFDIAMIALQHLKVPRLFVQILLFTYRYIFVLIAELRRRETAMKARGFVPQGNLQTLRTYGNFVGTLLVRSFERTDRIYKAMLSKGYEGEYRTLTSFAAHRVDWFKAALMLTIAVALFTADRAGIFAPAAQGWT